jgi:hypothetical protein
MYYPTGEALHSARQERMVPWWTVSAHFMIISTGADFGKKQAKSDHLAPVHSISGSFSFTI